MAGLDQFFVFDEANFINGQGRVLYSPLDVTDPVSVPASIADVFKMTSPYDPITGWYDLGATTAAPEYSSGRAVNQWKVQQQLATVKFVPTEITRTLKLQIGEISQEALLEMFENATETGTVSSGTDVSAQDVVYFGQYTDLLEYRFAVATFAPQDAGNVVEGTDGPTRPMLRVWTFNRCSLIADASTISFEIGDMVEANLTLQCLPEPSADQNEEHGQVFLEEAGTISVGE